MLRFFDKTSHAGLAVIGLAVGYVGAKLCNSDVETKRHSKAVKQLTPKEQAAHREDELAGMRSPSYAKPGK